VSFFCGLSSAFGYLALGEKRSVLSVALRRFRIMDTDSFISIRREFSSGHSKGTFSFTLFSPCFVALLPSSNLPPCRIPLRLLSAFSSSFPPLKSLTSRLSLLSQASFTLPLSAEEGFTFPPQRVVLEVQDDRLLSN